MLDREGKEVPGNRGYKSVISYHESSDFNFQCCKIKQLLLNGVNVIDKL